MEDVLVLQSFRSEGVPRWIERCMQSVRQWSAMHDYAYAFEADEFLHRAPQAYRDKVGPRLPVVADLARLLWMQEVLDAGRADCVVWLDADVYVFAPQMLRVTGGDVCQFGQEHWVQCQDGRWRVHRNVHNAFCVFSRGCATLPFLIEVVQRLVREVDIERMPPQFVGPKLLTSLHSIARFDLQPQVGALSPQIIDELIGSPGSALPRMSNALREPLLAANLCASLQQGGDAEDVEQRMERLLDVLDGFSSGLK